MQTFLDDCFIAKFNQHQISNWMIYSLFRFSEEKFFQRGAVVINRVGFRRISLKNLPQRKSRNICTLFPASTPVWSIFLLTACCTFWCYTIHWCPIYCCTNVVLCKYCTILCSTIIMLYHLILYCFDVAYLNIALFDISPF